MDPDEWENDIQANRYRKDEFFASYQSPLSGEELRHFKGLRYFPPDIAYRFELKLQEHREKAKVKIEDTKGTIRDFFRYGEFNFTVNDVPCTLQTYVSDPDETRLFIPFKDATTGKESYPAGRYLDLDAETDQLPNGMWVMDFNLAYNPWCAYSEEYACPLTPAENVLREPIRAGEMR